MKKTEGRIRHRWAWAGDGDKIKIHKTPLTQYVIRRYLRSVRNGFKGTYCQNCGVKIGRGFENKPFDYHGYTVCEYCQTDLESEIINNIIISTPNINDLLILNDWQFEDI